MALRTRADHYAGYSTGIRIDRLYPVSRMVSRMTGLSVQRNKAIVGENAFKHESGIHQDGMLKNPETYEIMDPRSIGVPESKLVLGKHSGTHALSTRLAELGYDMDAEQVKAVYAKFKALADRKKEVFDEDIEAIADGLTGTERPIWKLQKFSVSAGTDAVSHAFVALEDAAGAVSQQAAYGDGPIDACYAAIQMITNVPVKLERYETRAVTGGRDAQGEVVVHIEHNGVKMRGRGLSTDVTEAAVLAFVAAMNRIRA